MNMYGEDEEWIAYRNSFATDYDQSVMNGSSLQSFVINAGRKKMESIFSSKDVVDSVLEIGAGTGEHFPFINHHSNNYCFTDMDALALDVAKKKHADYSGNLTFLPVEIGDLPFPNESFDRVIATHVLEHIYQPHLALKEWNRLTKPGGIISILIPTDPGLLWKFGRTLGPRKRAQLRGEPYDYLMARDHVNPCHNLIALIRHYYSDITEQWWPLQNVPLYDLNLFYIAHCRKPKA